MEIKAGLIFKKPPRRLTIYNCRENITVIDDTVHSHPQGVHAAIDVLSNIGKNRKIAIIGQMRELGELWKEEYRKVGDYTQEKGIDVLVTYGAQTEEISEQAKLKGFSAENSYHFTDIDDYTDKDQLNALLKRIVK